MVNLLAILVFSHWETIPFHFIWISLTLLYGFRVWATRPTLWVLAVVMVTTFAAISWDVYRGAQSVDELNEVPLMAIMFWLMVWHAQRRLDADHERDLVSDENARLLATQRRFLQDASHQLRTPITIALGHAELLARELTDRTEHRDIQVVVGELTRLRRLGERLLVIAASEDPDFLRPEPVALDRFTMDVIRRWRPTADRQWQVGQLDAVTVGADRERLGLAVDALLENAVRHTGSGDMIQLSVLVNAPGLPVRMIVADTGEGIAPSELEHIFDRFRTGSPPAGPGNGHRAARGTQHGNRVQGHRAGPGPRAGGGPRARRRRAGAQYPRRGQRVRAGPARPGAQRRDAVPGAPAELVQQPAGARAGPDAEGQPMAKQEPMTQDPASTQEHDGPGAVPSSGPREDGPPAQPARGLRGWFGGLSRARKLLLTWSASVLAVVIALLAIGATSGGGTPKHAPPPRAPAFTLAQLGHAGPAHLAGPVRRPPADPELLRVLVRAVPAGDPADRPVLPQSPEQRHHRGHRRQRQQLGRAGFRTEDGRGLPGRVRPGADDHGAIVRGVGAAADVLPQRAAPHRQAGDPRGDPHRPAQRDSPHDQAERTELS